MAGDSGCPFLGITAEKNQQGKLQFENQAFVELLSEDGLALFARGLGLDSLFLKFLKLYCDPHSLVLVINASSELESYFVDELLRDNVQKLPKSVTSDFSSKERESLYLDGGVLFITSRILVVDMLRKLCPVDKVAGLLVYNAHQLTDSSTEAFILRLFRQDNKSGFIKAFSDAPEPFTNGFCQLERVMRSLFVKNLYLWPRFHATVSASLSRHKPDVVELRQQMTPAMTAIQMALLDIMKTVVSELKTTHPTLETEEVTVENCLSKSFDQIIHLHLDPVWNQLGSKTKQLVFDLRLLRTLLQFLTQYDCVTFFSYLDTVRSTKRSHALSSYSAWVFLESANTLFVKAHERVFGNKKGHSTSVSKEESREHEKQRPSESEVLKLEENPKWHLLSMVLDEVRRESRSSTGGQGKTLIVVNDERICHQLRQYLCDGGQKLLQRQFDRLLASKQQQEFHGLNPIQKRESEKEESISRSEGRKRSGSPLRFHTSDVGDEGRPLKIRRLEESIARSTQEREALGEKAFKDVPITTLNFDAEGKLHAAPSSDETAHFELVTTPVVILHALNTLRHPYHMTKVLKELQPQFIIMYDADISFVRQVEVFKASNPGMSLRIYFLLYDSSVEEQRYLTALRKEKEAFQQLIREYAHMTVPVDREGKVVDSTLLRRDATLAVEVVGSTRVAGGYQDKGPQKVIVDTREFRSSLPSLLHRSGVEIVPLTLEVGDYILTPDICVERKSISDLIGSLNSGRLYNQANAMTRHYQWPVLLIEFHSKRCFSLQGISSMSDEISSQGVSSKLVLLTLHFPKLRILWCSSPYATVDIFHNLKSGNLQPDEEQAVSVGQDTLVQVQSTKYSALTQDFLLKLPGINYKNYRILMDNVKDLQALVSLSLEQVEEILGKCSSANLLWKFLHFEYC